MTSLWSGLIIMLFVLMALSINFIVYKIIATILQIYFVSLFGILGCFELRFLLFIFAYVEAV